MLCSVVMHFGSGLSSQEVRRNTRLPLLHSFNNERTSVSRKKTDRAHMHPRHLLLIDYSEAIGAYTELKK